MSWLPGPPLRRTIFWTYAAVIFTLTHWPKLRVPGPIPRTDLVIHMGVFGLWTLLCVACAFFPSRHADRRSNSGSWVPRRSAPAVSFRPSLSGDPYHASREADVPLLGRRNIALSGLISLAMAGFDELTQAIPFVNRTAAWDDFLANALGVAAALLCLIALARLIHAPMPRDETSPTEPAPVERIP